MGTVASWSCWWSPYWADWPPGCCDRRSALVASGSALVRLPLLAAGAFGTALAQLIDGRIATLALAGSLAVLLAFAASNAHITGVLVIGCGLLLNLVAVVLNNGMPVRGGALVAAGVADAGELATMGFAGPRHLETSTDRLGVLGDVLPIPVAGEVLSFGDLIVVAGAVRRSPRAGPAATPGLEHRRSGARYRSTMTQLNVVQDWGTAPSGGSGVRLPVLREPRPQPRPTPSTSRDPPLTRRPRPSWRPPTAGR